MTGVGAVLFNVIDGAKKVVAFASKKFVDSAVNWLTIEQECFAVTKWRALLLGRFFCIECDHRNLVYIDKVSNGKIVMWKYTLQEYDFIILHIPVKNNEIADALSRCLVCVSRNITTR